MSVTADGPDRFLPTDDDRRRLGLEHADRRLTEWARSLHAMACGAFRLAVEAGSSSFVVPGLGPGDPDLSRVDVEVTVLRDEDGPDGGVAEIVLTICRQDWSVQQLAEHADILVLAAMITARGPPLPGRA